MGHSSKSRMQLQLSAICLPTIYLLLAIPAATVQSTVVGTSSLAGNTSVSSTVVAPTSNLVSSALKAVAPTSTKVSPTSTKVSPTSTKVSSTSTKVSSTSTKASSTSSKVSSTPIKVSSTSTKNSSTPIIISSSTGATSLASTSRISPSPSLSTQALASTSVVTGWTAWNVTCKEGGCCDENVAFNKNYTQHRTCLTAGNNCPSDAFGKNLTRSISCPKKTSDCEGCKSGAGNIQALAGLVSTMLVMALVLWI